MFSYPSEKKTVQTALCENKAKVVTVRCRVSVHTTYGTAGHLVVLDYFRTEAGASLGNFLLAILWYAH